MSIIPNNGKSVWGNYNTIENNVKYVIGRCYLKQGKPVTRHHHDQYELYIIEKGCGRLLFNDEWFDVKSGDVITIPENVLHCAVTDSEMTFSYIFPEGPFNNIKYYLDKK
mgnify:CR=1 FL=1